MIGLDDRVDPPTVTYLKLNIELFGFDNGEYPTLFKFLNKALHNFKFRKFCVQCRASENTGGPVHFVTKWSVAKPNVEYDKVVLSSSTWLKSFGHVGQVNGHVMD